MKTKILILVSIMSSCGDRMSKTLSDQMILEAADSEMAAPTLALANFPPSRESLNIPFERKLIKNGTLSFETTDIAKTKIEIDKLCKELNAYTASENQHNLQERLQNDQEIRVPAHNLISSF